jgi:hypothetical protein
MIGRGLESGLSSFYFDTLGKSRNRSSTHTWGSAVWSILYLPMMIGMVQIIHIYFLMITDKIFDCHRHVYIAKLLFQSNNNLPGKELYFYFLSVL